TPHAPTCRGSTARQQGKVGVFHRIVVRCDGPFLAQDVKIASGGFRIHAAIFVQDSNQCRVSAFGFLLVYFELVDDHLDAFGTVGTQPGDRLHHRGYRAADGFAIGFNLVQRSHHTDVRYFRQLAQLSEFLVAQGDGLVVKGGSQNRSDDTIAGQRAKTIRRAAGVDGADVLVVDLRFLQEGLKV